MPRINRIRIVNFSYNNDSRHILDEMFDFHGGENALLNLANGGGKSVLVQLFLQPVVPGARIQGRNIASFFQKKKLPAYIMIEWKLDGAGYLLTGIAIIPVEGQGTEDSRDRIRYFTFTSKYASANAFDIANIGVVDRSGSLLHVLPFREAREMMAEKERKDRFSFGYFPEDDTTGYARHLAEFGIIQNEWRTVIARINDNEHGLEEIFQKYKNSSQLLDDWIIKTIEQAQFKNRSEAHRLEEMLESLVQEVVENERFIVEKQLLDDFLKTFNEQVDKLHRLLNGLDQQEQLSRELAALYSQLSFTSGSLQEQYEVNEQDIDSCKAEQQRIHLEERSNDCWLRQTEYDEALQRLGAAETQSQETEDALQESRLREKIMQAACLLAEIHRKQAELSGIEEGLSAAREQYDTDGRMRSLEYSLKLLYQASLASIADDITRLQADAMDKEKSADQTQTDLQKAESQKSCLDEEKGRLKGQKEAFENQEKHFLHQLGMRLNRNLLGELEPAEIQKSQAALDHARDELFKKAQTIEDEKRISNLRQQDINHEVKALQSAWAEEYTALNGIERDMREYEQKELEISAILKQYEIDPQIRFDQERLATFFQQEVKKLEVRMEESARFRDDATEALLSLQDGNLHTPKELVSVFSKLDIPYDTGEAYLRTQEPEIRQRMLAGNPLLPYAFILSQADMERLPAALRHITLRRVIPLFTYEDLATTVPSAGRIAHTQEKLAFACLYEGRMFEPASLEKLLAELEHKKIQSHEQHDHFADAHDTAMSNRTVCTRFVYDADYRRGLEKSSNACQTRMDTTKARISSLEEETMKLAEREIELNQQSQAQHTALQKTEASIASFTDFITREADYQECRRKLSNALQAIKSLESRKTELSQGLESLRTALSDLKQALREKVKEQHAAQLRGDFFLNAPEAPTVTGSIEELEERLRVIRQEHSGEIRFLEQRREELISDGNKKQKELNQLDLPETTYRDTIYDEGEASRVREEIIRLQALLKKRRLEEKEAASKAGTGRGELNSALNEVKRLGAEAALPPAEIKGNFAERRKAARIRTNELDSKNKSIAEQIGSCHRIQEKIEQLIDLSTTEPAKEFIPDQDMIAQAKSLEQAFGAIKQESQNAADHLRITYSELKADYQGKNANIDNIFKGLSALWDKPDLDFDNYYYLYERMGEHGDKLSELITLYELQLTNLERNKKDMVQQSFMHSIMLFEEIQWISDNSKVRLQGRSRPVQMLKIDLQLDNQEAARQRMTDYIEECIRIVREETRQEKRTDQVHKTVTRLMSSRELLNVFLGNPHIQISVFKIDLNMRNSQLKRWEDAVRENSGGEKFVTFFSVLSALMTYSRSRATQAAGGDSNNDTRVLLMDNPFGPISSDHLLSPLFEIARKHRTQLICLSDLKQNSIMNCFNLIYMLKVRNNVIGNSEYLKIEDIVVRDESLVQHDERLEKAIFRTSDAKQVSLFDDI